MKKTNVWNLQMHHFQTIVVYRKTDSLEVDCYILLFLTLFRMGFFGAAHGWGGKKAPPPLPKICHTYPTIMKLGTVIPCQNKIQKIYESRDTGLEFC